MHADVTGAIGTREIITSDASVLTGLLLVGAAAFDMVWLLLTAVAISTFPKPLAVAVAAVVFFGAIGAQVIAARRSALSFDDDTVWWTTGLGKVNQVPRENVRFGVRHRFGIAQATISNGSGPPILVPRLAVVTWTNPEATVAVRELDVETGKPRDWVDTGERWTDLDADTLARTLEDEDALTRVILSAPQD